jgi:hypothetical protein
MNYHHGYFMGIGLGLFLIGFIVQVFVRPETLKIDSFQVLTVLGALLLGYGTGRCDQKACM